MRKQKLIWQKEHLNKNSLPSLADQEPSSAAVYFGTKIKNKIKPGQKLVDIGAGKGRNAIYFAKLGLEVYCLEYIQQAVEAINKLACIAKVKDKVKTFNCAVDSKWPFENSFFDYSLDCFSSIDIETRKGREIYRGEMLRTLKPGGSAFVAVVSIKDEWESKLLLKNPGKEKNSVVWPSGKFQKNYDEQELKDFYKNFKIVEIKKVQKKAFKLGKNYTAENFLLTLQSLI